MKAFKTTFDKNKSFTAEPGYIIDNYLTAEADLGCSVVRAHLDGKHPLMKNTSSNKIYYFIKGQAKFFVGDEEFFVNEGDMMTIPKNTIYKFEGKFDAILISCPAFNPADYVIYN